MNERLAFDQVLEQRLALTLCTLLLAAPAAAEECATLTPAEVTVVDGDTIRALGETWRLTLPEGGYDTPETHRPGCLAEAMLGAKAAERLQELVQGGELVICTDGRRGRYGRLLGWLSAGGQDVGRVLLEEGLAQGWPRERGWCR